MAENLIKRMGFIPDASPEDIKTEAVIHASELIKMLEKVNGMNPDIMLQILATAIRIAVLADGTINDRERELIKAVFREISDATDEELENTLALIDHPLDDRSYKIAEDLFRMSNALGMEFINLVICFAYADDVLEDEIAERLSEIMHDNVRFVRGDPEF